MFSCEEISSFNVHKRSGCCSDEDILPLAVHMSFCHHADERPPQMGNPHAVFHHIAQKYGLEKGGCQIDGGNLVLLCVIMAG